MHTRTKAVILGAVTGSSLLAGTGLAVASSHDNPAAFKPATPGSGDRGIFGSRPCPPTWGGDLDDAFRLPAQWSGRFATGALAAFRQDDEVRESGDGDDEDSIDDKRSRDRSEKSKHRRKSPRPCPPGANPTRQPTAAPTVTPTTPPPSGPSVPPSPTTGPVPTTTPPAPPPTPDPTPTPACTSVTGSPGVTASPGDGTVTVTITVCDGAITAATAVQVDNSGWDTNKAAIPELNKLAVQYYKTDLSKITYSGATLTAKSYQTSLSSAMTKAGI